MRASRKLASIDIGTNSVRLLVAECDGERTATIDRRMVITRLGEGVDESRRLSPAAVERTGSVLKEYREAIDGHSPEVAAAAATSAVRDSANGDEFLDLAEGLLGFRPAVLPGAEEARLSYLGAVSDPSEEPVEPGKKVLVFDIGGGSTEFIWQPAEEGGLGFRSVNVGCVRMSERFMTTDPPSPVAVGRMESHIVSQVKAVLGPMKGEIGLAVGLAGTVTTVSGINQGLEEYDTDRIHHSRLSRTEVEEVFRGLASVGLEERRRVMGFEPGRADIIVGGIAVLRVIMDLAGLEEILVSEKDILDGLVLDLYGSG